MLERFKNYSAVGVKFESFEERDVIVDYLKKNGYRCASIDNNLDKCILRINQDDKTLWCVDALKISNKYDKNFVFIQSKDIITLDMKKKMYFTKDQLRCVEYVENELDWITITDLYVDDFGLVVKGRNGDMKFEDAFDDFFQEHVCRVIEDEFWELMNCDWDDLDYQYEMLKLSRKCMRELK